MFHGFAGYLAEQNLLNEQQATEVFEAIHDFIPNYEFAAIYFFDLNDVHLVLLKELLNGEQCLTFEEALKFLSLFDEEKSIEWKQNGLSEDTAHAHIICNKKFLDAKTVSENLLLYTLNSAHNHDITHLPKQENQMTNIFVKEYSQIVLSRVKAAFDYGAVVSEVIDVKQLYTKLLISQEIADEYSFLIGISTSFDSIKNMMRDYYRNRLGLTDMSEFDDTDEDKIDFLCEFLNNTNGLCTYKFSTGFDLSLPEAHQNVILSAPKIYKIKYETYLYDIIFIIIYGKDYKLEQVGK